MKLLSVFLLCGSLVVSAAGYSQNKRVTIQETTISIEELFEQIENSVDCRFAYSNSQLNPQQVVSVNVKDSEVEEVLNQVLDKNLTYKLIENYYVIVDKQSNTESRAFIQQELVVKGLVTDDKGEPLPGVNVFEESNRTNGVITGIDGNYSIKVGSESTALTFSFIGYEAQTIQVAGRSEINITLVEETTGLDEVVVVGFGSQKKANLTGSVSTVNSEILESRPVQNVGQALQGVVPGLNLSTAGFGGELNQELSVDVRGVGTVGDDSKSSPLILVDGMEGSMNALSPQDIESITVLKDAAASSIYGSRAAFGVILITTKQGKEGKTTINYNNNFRWTKPMGLPTMLDSYKFALYWNEAAANAGEGAKFSDEVLERIVQYQNGEIDYGTVPDANNDSYMMYTGSNANTDWFKEHYKNSAFAQDHAISANGGNENIRFYTSANYLDQEGLSRHADDEFQRYTFTAKTNAKLTDYAKLNTSVKFIREDYETATHMDALFYHNIARRWPTVPVTDPNGHYTYPSEINQLRDGGRRKDQDDWLYLQSQLIINPLENWNIFAEGNYRIRNYNKHQDVLPAYAYKVDETPYGAPVGWNPGGYSSVYEYSKKDNFFTSNIYSDYSFKLANDHNFKVMAGINTELMQYRTLAASRSNLITPSLPTINTATENSRADEGTYEHWSTMGLFGRLNYNYKERYLLEVNARYDGTSRFMEDKRWNVFPSLSLGWNVARENFWTFDHILQTFKIRASYGELGNQNTENLYPFYSTMPVLVNHKDSKWLVNGEKPTIASAPDLVSTLLTWERVSSWNIGTDLAFFKNRLNVNFDYFNRTTYDMVGPAPQLPVTLGTDVPRMNNADMQSYGFELEALWKDKVGALNYSVRAVLSDSQQKITRYPNETGAFGQDLWREGMMLGEIWGYTTAGIAKSQEEMDAHLANVDQSNMGSNWQAGDIMYADTDGDGEINSGASTEGNHGDLSIIGNSTPRYRFSLDLNAQYKGFDMRLFFQGVAKRDYMPNGPYFWGAVAGMWQSAGFDEQMDFYRDENSTMVLAGVADVNKDSYFPRPYFGGNANKNQKTQTRYIQDASYIRLKNIQLGYTLPNDLTSRVGISKARFFVSAENVFTLTNLFNVFDPETIGLSGWNDGKTYPLSSVVSCGVNVTF